MTTLLIILGAIAALIIVAALLIDKHMRIEKFVVINKPASEVFNYVRYVRNQDNFSKWNMADPNMHKTYSGTDGQVGFIYAWDSATNKNVGAGEQEIKNIDEGNRIDFELRFSRPMKNVAQAAMVVNPIADNTTQVMWGFYGDSAFPMTLFKPIFQKMLGRDLQEGLDTLKNVLEK